MLLHLPFPGGVNPCISAVYAAESPVVAAQQITKVVGTVTSEEDGEPVIGAHVKVDGTNIGVITDADGNFVINNIPSGAKKVTISFLGMKPKTVEIAPVLKVILESASESLDEVMVVAYGTAKKSTFTGSANTVNSANIERQPVTSLTEALVGSAPGVQVTTANGQPGSSPSIYIRGVGSMSANNEPLIVLDGMPYDNSISSINPNDIESISVLKDAASSALYGARAANGVLMITTKKGNKERVKVNLKLNEGFTTKQSGDYNKVGVADYLKLYWENSRNRYVADGKSYEDAGVDAAKYLFQELSYNPYNLPADQVLDNNGNLNPNAKFMWADDTDWEDAIQRTGNRTDIALSISGGTNKTDFFTSIGFTKENGYIIGSKFKRYTARANVNSQITNWLKVGTNLSANMSFSDGNQNESQNNNINPFRFTRFMGPIYPIHVHNPETGEYLFDSDGNKIYDFGTGYSVGGIEVPKRDYVSGNNPAIELQNRYDSNKRNTINAKIYAEVRFLKDFKFTLNGGVGSNSYLSSSASIVYPEKGNTGDATKSNSFTTTWTFNQLLQYTKTFGRNTIDILVGHESYDYEYNYLSASMKDQNFSGNYELANYANLNATPSSYTNRYKTEGYLSRLNYDFDDRYFVSASFRRDGSSRFARKSRWGNFWSVGAGWRIDQEAFMKDLEFVNLLKLRTAYGEVGNDDVGGYYPWRAVYEKAQNAEEPGYIQSSLGNANLKWEVSRNFDVALEFALWNRFRGTLEFFNRQSDNLLFSVPLSPSTGMSNQDMNTGTMYNRGFEVELTYDILQRRDWQWSVTINTTSMKNKITKLPVDPYTSSNHRIEEGYSRYNFYLRQFKGVDPATGSSYYVVDPQYLESSESLIEIDGQKYTTKISEGEYAVVANAIPTLNGGLTTNVAYKGFSLTLAFYYQLGGKMYDTSYSSLMSPSTGSLSYQALHVDLLNRWQKPGDITDVPRISNGSDATDLTGSSDRWLVSSDMLELTNINFGYAFPRKWTNVLGVNELRVFTSANNLFQITARKGIYPRKNVSGYASNGDVYLPSRVFNFGVNVTF
ncbi:MAG: TonB-dependent receptor [Muribaculaceae bacterium]|nr:TonB-dependent receptor [Muribaculaceae bacterium]